MVNALLTGVRWGNTNLSHAILTGAKVDHLQGCVLTGCQLGSAILTGCDLRQVPEFENINRNLRLAQLQVCTCVHASRPEAKCPQPEARDSEPGARNPYPSNSDPLRRPLIPEQEVQAMGRTLQGFILDRAVLTKIVLAGCSIQNCQLGYTDLSGHATLQPAARSHQPSNPNIPLKPPLLTPLPSPPTPRSQPPTHHQGPTYEGPLLSAATCGQ